MTRRLAFCAAVIFCAGLRAQSVQGWPEVDLTGKWHGVSFTVPLLARLDTVKPNPQLAATGVLADFPVHKHLTLTGGYFFVDVPAVTPQDVHVPLIALTPDLRWKHVTLADRNRFEWLGNYSGQPWRYRNRSAADFAMHRKGDHLFIDDEVIWNLSTQAWSQNRLRMGGGVGIAHNNVMDIYYLRRDTAGAPVTHVIGGTLRLKVF